MNKLILSINPGKYLTKAIALKDDEELIDTDFLKNKRVFFRSKMYDLDDGDVELHGKSYFTEYDGRKIIIGDQGNVDGAEETNKATLLHKLCIYTAITQYIVPDEKTDVYMVLSCPLNLLKSKEYKNEYREFIGNEGKEISISVNNENYVFTIKSITIKSERSGVSAFRCFKTGDSFMAASGFGGAVNEGNFDINQLTRSQQKVVKAADNIINDHLTEDDFSGTLRDLQGNPVPKQSGGFWNHLQEMKDSYVGLKRAQGTLEGSLKNPNLTADSRIFLQNKYDTIKHRICKG